MRTMTRQAVLLALAAVLVPTGAAAQQVGLTGGVNLHEAHASGVHLFVGPTSAVMTSAVYRNEGEPEHLESDLYGQTDVGLTVGGGVRIGRASLDARYTWGLTSLLTDGDTEASLKNETFSVSAGFVVWRPR